MNPDDHRRGDPARSRVTVLALAAVTFILGRAGKLKQTIV